MDDRGGQDPHPILQFFVNMYTEMADERVDEAAAAEIAPPHAEIFALLRLRGICDFVALAALGAAPRNDRFDFWRNG